MNAENKQTNNFSCPVTKGTFEKGAHGTLGRRSQTAFIRAFKEQQTERYHNYFYYSHTGRLQRIFTRASKDLHYKTENNHKQIKSFKLQIALGWLISGGHLQRYLPNSLTAKGKKTSDVRV